MDENNYLRITRQVLRLASAAAVTCLIALYIGDSGVDMQTAINSGVTSCGVMWEFRPRT